MAYIIGDISIRDPSRYDEYKEGSLRSASAYGGVFLVRGHQVEILEGEWAPGRLVIVQFPTTEIARAWYESEEYAPYRRIREEIADSSLLLVDGA